MENRKDTTPAFPVPGDERNNTWPGMTLRDYFAGKVVCGLVSSLDSEDVGRLGKTSSTDRASMFAYHAYLVADAMIEQRSK